MPFSMTLSWPSPEDGLALPGQRVEGRGFKKKNHCTWRFSSVRISFPCSSSSPSPLLVGCGGWGREWGQLLSLSLLLPCTSATRMLPVLPSNSLLLSQVCVCERESMYACACLLSVRVCTCMCASAHAHLYVHIKYIHKGHLFLMSVLLGLGCLIGWPSQVSH